MLKQIIKSQELLNIWTLHYYRNAEKVQTFQVLLLKSRALLYNELCIHYLPVGIIAYLWELPIVVNTKPIHPPTFNLKQWRFECNSHWMWKPRILQVQYHNLNTTKINVSNYTVKIFDSNRQESCSLHTHKNLTQLIPLNSHSQHSNI